MIHPDILSKLPEGPPREKLLLLDALATDALAAADEAQTRLNDIGRRQASASEALVVRYAAIVDLQSNRHSTLSVLTANCARWLRDLRDGVELEVVAAARLPSLMDEGGALSPEEAVMKIREKFAEAATERFHVARTPEPKAVLKAKLRAQVRRLAAAARPSLDLRREAAELAVFKDPKADFGLTEAYLVGVMAWLDPERMDQALDGLIDDLPSTEEMTAEEHAEALAELDRETENLQRVEEALITEAFARGVDILRRPNADVACVLGVRVIKPAVAPRPARRPRLPRPAEADARAAE